MKEVTEIIQEAARLGGNELLNFFGTAKILKTKSVDADFVTEADIASNTKIVSFLKEQLPEYNILSEEDPYLDNKSDYTLIIDPLDGTNNFSIGLAMFTVSIAVRYKDRCVVGVVYNPVLDHMYYAWNGGGAYKNGDRLHVNTVGDITKSRISFTGNYGMPLDFLAEKYGNLIAQKKVQRLFTNWSVALDLCLVAEGYLEGMINYGSEEYDYAAGLVIATEADAKVTYFENRLSYDIDPKALSIISNGTEVHRHLEDIVI